MVEKLVYLSFNYSLLTISFLQLSYKAEVSPHSFTLPKCRNAHLR